MTTSIGLSALVATAMALQVAAPPPQEPRTARPLTLPLVQTVTSSPATQGATAQTPATPPALVRDADARLAAQRDGVLQLHVGGVTLREDGSQMGGAFTGGDDQFERYIYASATSCAYGTSADEPVAPRVAWRVRATVVERTADGVAAQIEWARLWSEGQRLADGPTGSSRVTMRSGARLLLDAVTFEPGGPCRATTMRLEAAVGSGPFTGSVAMGGFGGGRGGRGGSIVGRPSTGSGTGTSAGGATSVGGTGSSTASAGGGVARGRGGRGTSGSAGTGTGGAASAGTVGAGGTGATDATGATASATPPGTGGAGAGRGGGRGGAGAWSDRPDAARDRSLRSRDLAGAPPA